VCPCSCNPEPMAIWECKYATPSCLLLTSHASMCDSPHAFSCPCLSDLQLADFGLSRLLAEKQTHIETERWGARAEGLLPQQGLQVLHPPAPVSSPAPAPAPRAAPPNLPLSHPFSTTHGDNAALPCSAHAATGRCRTRRQSGCSRGGCRLQATSTRLLSSCGSC